MKKNFRVLLLLNACALLVFAAKPLSAQETDFEFDFVTGENANIGGILFPRLYSIATFGAFEPGAKASDFATNEHDPQVDSGFQNIEGSLFLNIEDVITGRATGFVQDFEDGWEWEMEEYFVMYNPNDIVSIGGGQFLNMFGFQSHRHLHGWDYVNNNLVNARIVNEGELITQGGRLVIQNPDRFAMLTIGAGGVRSHGHGHGHEEEDEEHGHHDEEERHVEADDANFNDWVATADLKWAIDEEGSAMGTASFGVGENGFGETTLMYGFGFQKVWGGRDSGRGYQDLAPGAFMIRSEFIGRDVDAIVVHEDEDEVEPLHFDEEGISTSVYYGINDFAKISFRHDWVAGVEELEERPDYHRFSPALTTAFGPQRRIKTRLQYDYNDFDGIESEHVGWLQVEYFWGGTVGGYFRE